VQASLRSAGIDPASAIGAQTAAELRLNAALTETKALATDALSTLEDDFMRGADGATILRDELGLLTKEVLKLANQNIIAGLFGGAGSIGGGGGGIGGLFASLFGGFRAGGGDVQAGKAYVVGERRPELFIPSVNGRIAPQVSSGSSDGGVTIIQNFNNTFQGMTGSDRQWVESRMVQIGGQAKQAALSEMAARGARRG
jgi:hypothetical protein